MKTLMTHYAVVPGDQVGSMCMSVPDKNGQGGEQKQRKLKICDLNHQSCI